MSDTKMIVALDRGEMVQGYWSVKAGCWIQRRQNATRMTQAEAEAIRDSILALIPDLPNHAVVIEAE